MIYFSRLLLRAADLENATREMPERVLLRAILDRAIKDAFGATLWSDKAASRTMRRKARDWLQVDHVGLHMLPLPEAFSFQWICEHLGIEPECLHKELRSCHLGYNSQFIERYNEISFKGRVNYGWVKRGKAA